MHLRVLAVLGVCIAASAPEVRACSLVPPEPPLAGEGNEAYQRRIEALGREREAHRPAMEAEWLRHRQAEGLERASMIFIARNTPWASPPVRSNRRRVPIPPPVYSPYFSFSYFTPVAWLRGRQSRAPFRLEATMNSCGGLSGIGDATDSIPGAQLIFFATGEPFTSLTLIDAIAIDKITDPTLLAFVARSRRQ